MITGATGGVGIYALQLATLAGTVVTAHVRDLATSAAPLQRLGATDGEFDLIIEAVGGTTSPSGIDGSGSRRRRYAAASGDYLIRIAMVNERAATGKAERRRVQAVEGV